MSVCSKHEDKMNVLVLYFQNAAFLQNFNFFQYMGNIVTQFVEFVHRYLEQIKWKNV